MSSFIKNLKTSTILNILATIVMAIPIVLYFTKDIPFAANHNRIVFAVAVIIFMTGQIVDYRKRKKDGEEIDRSCFGNLIALLIVLALVIFNFK